MQNTNLPLSLDPEKNPGPRPKVRAYYLSLAPLIPWPRTARPLNWADYFGREAPLEVEIGFGNGEFLIRKAKAHPERNLVGLELSWESVKRALRRTAQAGLDNVKLLRIDARGCFQRLFRPRSLDRAYSLFPSPWPKERHAGRRLFSTDFLRLAASRLVDGAEFQIVTDHRPLSEWIISQVPGSGFTASLQTIPAGFRTKYERKWQENGQDVFHEIILQKTRHYEVPLTEDVPLMTFHLTDFDPGRFRPRGQEGPLTVAFKDFLYDPERRKGMLRALVAEDDLAQHVWIEVVDKGDGWRLSLAPGSNVLPTQGVKRALELAFEAASG